ncbi:hypothetical protein ParKJ_22905 [Paraburkholderia fungorum]|uniref:Uncharacterized protein n=1 Tax=Paraburkholderia fungorum TaxID=134537 RepID=A0AAP5QAR4_9BURK|nr:hypothetical protein [Paraburkholderia fungorum]MDT8840278.1 hypothetical protein [Paraburkholderia fungorum]
MEGISLKMTWAGTLNAFLALYERGDRKYAREQLINMARLADFGADAKEAFERIANMTDRDGNTIEMHREELRAIARSALALLGPSKQDPAPKKIDAA